MLCEVRNDLILVVHEGAWNGMEPPTITCACFYSPQEPGSFQLIHEEFRVQISSPYWEGGHPISKLSQLFLRKYQKKGRRERNRQFVVIYYFAKLWSIVTLADIHPSPAPLLALARSKDQRTMKGGNEHNSL